MIRTDVVVIGAGPAGLYATYYAGFRGFKVLVVDALSEIGGQITAMYPEKEIFDIAGFPAVKGRDLVDGLIRQAQSANPTYKLATRVEKLEEIPNGIRLVLDSKEVVETKAVIIAGGIGAFTPRALPVGMEWLGKGLVHFVPSLIEHKDKNIVIAGGGDSAFDWAYSLKPIAKSVTLVHRRDAFRAHAATVEQVKNMGVELITSAEISEVNGDDQITSVEIVFKETGEKRQLDCDTLVAALGFVANIGPIAEWGLQLEKRHIAVSSNMETSIKRVFAVGDIATYAGKVPLISVGFGEAALAINNAAPYIDEHSGVFPGHSSGSSSD